MMCYYLNVHFQDQIIKARQRVRSDVKVRGHDEVRGVRLHTIKRRKADWISHILCRNGLLKRVIEENIENGEEFM